MDATAKKVLIIDDEEKVTLVLKDLLEKSGLIALSASDGKIGLDIALAERPDLILLDLKLPVMDGMAFLEALRKDSWGKDAVVVAFTNNQSEESLKSTRAFGVKEYIVKSNWTAKEMLNRALIFIDRKID